MKFRFTIRDLLWLTVVAALLVAGWLDRQHLRSENARLLAENEDFLDTLAKQQVAPPVAIWANNEEAIEPPVPRIDKLPP